MEAGLERGKINYSLSHPLSSGFIPVPRSLGSRREHSAGDSLRPWSGPMGQVGTGAGRHLSPITRRGGQGGRIGNGGTPIWIQEWA